MYFLSESIMDQNLSKICRSSFRPPGPSLRVCRYQKGWLKQTNLAWLDTSCQRRRSQESKNISSAWGRVWCERSKQTWWGACIYLRTCLAKDLGRTSPWSRDMPQFSSLNLANNGNWKMGKRSCCEELSEDHLVPAADACLDIGETLLPTWNLDLRFYTLSKSLIAHLRFRFLSQHNSKIITCISRVLCSRSENISIWSWLQYFATFRNSFDKTFIQGGF